MQPQPQAHTCTIQACKSAGAGMGTVGGGEEGGGCAGFGLLPQEAPVKIAENTKTLAFCSSLLCEHSKGTYCEQLHFLEDVLLGWV